MQINSRLDREVQDNYNITIIAIDQGSPPLTGTTIFEVTVTDVNDELPRFSKTAYTHSLLENTTENVGVEIIQCEATDVDVDSDLYYTILDVMGYDENGRDVNASLIQVLTHVFVLTISA